MRPQKREFSFSSREMYVKEGDEVKKKGSLYPKIGEMTFMTECLFSYICMH